MKIPAAALILLTVIAVCVTANALVADRLTDKMSQMANETESFGTPSLSDQLDREWKSHRVFFYVTVQQGRLDQIDQAIGLIRAGEQTQSDALCETGRIQFIKTLEQIRSEAGFDLCRIF